MDKNPVTAKQITEFLAYRHREDLFISQCKTGGTEKGVLILDGWAMKASWASPLITGYEIKVSRGDFLQDNKWRAYLPYVNEFYFITPKDLIKPDEIPEGVGLLYFVGTRFLTKKKAWYHETGSELENLLKYILMWRSNLVQSQNHLSREERISWWQNELERKQSIDHLGYSLSKNIQRRIREEITNVNSINNQLQYENNSLSDIKKFLEKVKIDYKSMYSWEIKKSVIEKLEEICGGLPKELTNSLENLKQLISKIEDSLSTSTTQLQEKS